MNPIEGAIKARVVDLAHEHAHYFHADFPQWLAENFDLWVRFEAEAEKLRRRGRTHYSAYTIVEYLRHHTALQQECGDMKINGNVVASLARFYVLMHPSAFAFFEFRTIKNKHAPLGVKEATCA